MSCLLLIKGVLGFTNNVRQSSEIINLGTVSLFNSISSFLFCSSIQPFIFLLLFFTPVRLLAALLYVVLELSLLSTSSSYLSSLSISSFEFLLCFFPLIYSTSYPNTKLHYPSICCTISYARNSFSLYLIIKFYICMCYFAFLF